MTEGGLLHNRLVFSSYGLHSESNLDRVFRRMDRNVGSLLAGIIGGKSNHRRSPRNYDWDSFGSYELSTLIGKGGMSEAYLARDTRLNRDVAIKVLPNSLAGDPHHLARRREAQVLASLNHPNIAAIYGVEENSGMQALVLRARRRRNVGTDCL
jgi:serine/threonine protein kinase